MSVIIEGFNKPKNCHVCPFNNSDCYCNLTKGNIDRDDWDCSVTCPIKTLEQEPFMNKPCVANQVCHEDKVKMLDKIRNEFIDRYPHNYANELELGGRSRVFSLNEIFREKPKPDVLNKIRAEIEGYKSTIDNAISEDELKIEGMKEAYADCLEIINKYKAERNEYER